MSMKNEFGGKIVGMPLSDRFLWDLMVEHDGSKFCVLVWGQNAQHAIARLAVMASARYFYRVLDVSEVPECDYEKVCASRETVSGS